MRFHRRTRLLAFGMWVVLAAIAVTGFAAFDTDMDADDQPEPDPMVRQEVVGVGPSPVYTFTVPEPTTTTTPSAAIRSVVVEPERTILDPNPAPTTTTTTAPPTTTTTTPPTTTTTTPPTTTTTTAPTPGPPSTEHPESVEVWRPLVETWFPAGEIDRALDVMWCESRGDETATNPTSGAAGLFQHIPRYWEERSVAAGFAGADIYDPEANVGVAAWLVARDGWKHWYPSLHCWG